MADAVFKFLDAYTKEDKDWFFGREQDELELYEMTFNTRLMLIYGASGTGKTSLVQCGLSRRFGAIRWKALYVRRSGNIMQSLRNELEKEIAKYAYPGMERKKDLLPLIEQLQKLAFTPVYLIFDQFEELFTLRPRDDEEQAVKDRYEAEKAEFYQFVIDATNAQHDSSCHILLVIREEFIAHLWEFEKKMPNLFRYRYRVERMRPEQVEDVIGKMLKIAHLKFDEAIPATVVERLKIGKSSIELTYLQVYLTRLYELAVTKKTTDSIYLSTELLDKMGKIEDVIGELLDTALRALEASFPKDRQGLPLRLLGAMVSDEKTKKVLSDTQLREAEAYHKLGMTEDEYDKCIRVFDSLKIIRRYES